MTTVRLEKDSFGEIEIPIDAYYGSQTARSLKYFNIGETMPSDVVHALVIVKKCAAEVNCELGLLPQNLMKIIVKASDEILAGQFADQFPLKIYQTGSGTQTNMNVNEVIAARANELVGEEKYKKSPVHPNDHVNMGQSTNDAFPTAMHIATTLALKEKLIPALQEMESILGKLANTWAKLIKIGRTHMQDATPITLGQEFSGYTTQIVLNMNRIENTFERLSMLAQGGTAVGTGLNCHPKFAQMIAERIAKYTGHPFVSARNKFEALASNDTMVEVSGALNTLAVSCMKIANDVRLLGSGPRSGLGELSLPENEPGSSIMPGKVNPTQCEALTMVCCKVFGNHTTVTVAGSQGHLELNVYKPVIISSVLESIELLSDAIVSFTNNCLAGLKPNERRLEELLKNSLMLVTALSPKIGYEKAAEIAKKAHIEGTSLKEMALQLGYVTDLEFDTIVDPKLMV